MAFPLFAPRRLGPQSSAPPPPNGRLPSVLGKNAAVYPRGREVGALLFWTFGLFLALALFSYKGESVKVLAEHPEGPRLFGGNWVGPVGEAFAHALVNLVGVVAWALPLEALLLGIPYVRGKKSEVTPARLGGDLLIAILSAALVQVGWPGAQAFGSHEASGLVGELFGELARSLFSTIGSFLVGFAILGLLLIARASFSFIALMNSVARLGRTSASKTASGAAHVADAWRTARALDRAKQEEEAKARAPKIDLEAHDDAQISVLPLDDGDDGAFGEAATDTDIGGALPVAMKPNVDQAHEVATALLKKSVQDAPKLRPVRAPKSPSLPPALAAPGALADADAEEESEGEDDAEPDTEPEAEAEAPPPVAKRRGRKGAKDASGDPSRVSADQRREICVEEALAEALPLAAKDDSKDVRDGASDPKEPKEPKARKRASKAPPEGPTIVDTTAALEVEAPEPVKAEKGKVVPAIGQGFRLPPIDFLALGKVDPSLVIDEALLRRNADLLVKTLSDYKVSGTVEEIHPGPVVTTFEVAPVAGTKVSRVASLADDLALALGKKVRIVAPIPGKSRIGFELPNEKRLPVNLRDLIEDRRFQSLDVPLPVVLGRDIVGNPVYADLASMPHVIVAGATGAGKSVGLNVMLTSLLYRRSPEELRMLMIDPKVVELAPFDRIPHMLLPVVTDMKQAANALKWAVDEMERRYQLFADAGTKNITTYNGWVGRVQRGETRNPFPKQVIAKDHNGFSEAIRPDSPDEGEQPIPETMPFIVIVVDEFADLMMQQGKEVETSVARLAQKARAAGMHVILATQRPSVDVITGMIKANFPTRVAFRVAQKIDSRTILDEQGAEHLLGKGDMLIKLNGTNDTKRVQCPWVSEEEVQAVTDFLRLQGEPVYDENILKPRDEDGGSDADEEAEADPMYDDALRIVADTRRCSTSWLQRKLGLGYNRAARIVETMEKRGIVGPPNGSKDREVLISSL